MNTTTGNILIYQQFKLAVQNAAIHHRKNTISFILSASDYSNILSSDINQLMTEITKLQQHYPVKIKSVTILGDGSVSIQFKRTNHQVLVV